jgi:hypothetical protein
LFEVELFEVEWLGVELLKVELLEVELLKVELLEVVLLKVELLEVEWLKVELLEVELLEVELLEVELLEVELLDVELLEVVFEPGRGCAGDNSSTHADSVKTRSIHDVAPFSAYPASHSGTQVSPLKRVSVQLPTAPFEGGYAASHAFSLRVNMLGFHRR